MKRKFILHLDGTSPPSEINNSTILMQWALQRNDVGSPVHSKRPYGPRLISTSISFIPCTSTSCREAMSSMVGGQYDFLEIASPFGLVGPQDDQTKIKKEPEIFGAP